MRITLNIVICTFIVYICTSYTAMASSLKTADSLNWPDSVESVSIEVQAIPLVRFVVSPNRINMSINNGKQMPLQDSVIRTFILNRYLNSNNSNLDNVNNHDKYYVKDAPKIIISLISKGHSLKKYNFKPAIHDLEDSICNNLECDFSSIISSYTYMSSLYFDSIKDNKKSLSKTEELFNGADSVIVSFFEENENIYSFHLKQVGSYMSSNDSIGFSMRISDILPGFVTVNYSTIRNPFIQSITDLHKNQQLGNRTNTMSVDIRTYKNGRLIRSDKYYKPGAIGQKRIRYDMSYFDFISILKDLVNIYELNKKYQRDMDRSR